MRILIIEDDTALRNIVTTILEEEAYEVEASGQGKEGLWMARSGDYDLVIVDLMLPEMDGITVIQELYAEGKDTPTLILTAKDRVEDKVKGLDVGADDYLVKPFATEEFLARVRSVLRRAGKLGIEGRLHYGPMVLDTRQQTCRVDEQELKLTKKEYELLHYLIQNREQILIRDQIYDRVWGLDSNAGETVVDVYIHYLRKKLSGYSCGEWIRTVRGVGYMLSEE
ncbi:response regulator transcription factor [Paenibacillus sp. JX-17]|uniref:Response regulator transcription factor n=1 Tax=Paenibacillus lacisoli TaxID=3064525 RepID=A0ABT9CCH9_9BACL|nr:response regulator transcription factor [Paenibacillus sp. JX-17]MDO7906278.1 response regulator transcription factor [Paenibacillus sp. JX-17]